MSNKHYFDYCFIGMVKAEDLLVSAPSDRNKKPWIDIGAAVTTDNGKMMFNLSQFEYEFINYKYKTFTFMDIKFGHKFRSLSKWEMF